MAFNILKKAMNFYLLRRFISNFFSIRHQSLRRNLFGIDFPNPVGLAAGLDKDACYVDELSALGFGFVEVGTLTPKPQSGNDKPRLFRLKEDAALINRMGFNNKGVEYAKHKLAARKSNIIVGGNIGKNKTTPNENALADYVYCFETLYEYVDYFVVNVSSPNTPNLRELQDKEPLRKILSHLVEKNRLKPKPKPILLKIAPDLSNEQLDDIIELYFEVGIQGIVATNTTIHRDGLRTDPKRIQAIGNGGLSGKPLFNRSTEVVRYIAQRSGGKIPIIAVGGIHSVDDAIEKFKAGASLVQLYTGFIYEGPGLIKKINESLIRENHQ